MINKKRKKFCAEPAISSPPRLAAFVKPRPLMRKRALLSLATTDNFFPQTIGLAVSVVVPMFNAAEYIGECLESVLNQTFQNFEVIVVDDCSTDNSVEIVESYLPQFNDRLTLQRLEENSGTGGSVPRNVGCKLARGEYVYFIDADDYIAPSALETFYRAAKRFEADVVYTAAYNLIYRPDETKILTDASGQRLLEENLEDKPTLTIDDQNKILQQLDVERNFNFPWTHFVRRDFLIQNNILFPEIPNGVDHLWSLQVYCYTKRFLRIPDALYFYRRYQSSSISTTKREPSEQLSYWVSTFSLWLKVLNELSNKIEALKNNLPCALAAARRHFDWCLNRTGEARKKLSNQDIYEILYQEFSTRDDLADFTMPFIFSVCEEQNQTIDQLTKELYRIKKLSSIPYPAVSVIIPMYNAEQYIGECLDSLLEQSFQNFEVIIGNDGSTDSSCEIVESYIPKFNGRLKLYHMAKNTKQPGIVRNMALSHAQGEYIYCMDSDDMFTNTAVEEVLFSAKEHDADVVYCERYYMSEGVGEDFIENTRLAHFRVQPPPYVNKPTFETEDLAERIKILTKNRYWTTPWLKLVRRSLLEENNLFFPPLRNGEDDIWTYGLVFFAKKWLRVPNLIYIRRIHEDSIMGATRTPQQMMNFCLAPALLGMKSLDDLMSRHEFFQSNPSYRYFMLEYFLKEKLSWAFREAKNLRSKEVYEAIREVFSDKLDEYGVLIPALCSFLYKERNQSTTLERYRKFLTARIDIKLLEAEGDFQVIYVSDEKAEVSKPDWLQDNGTGYVISSLSGNLTFVVKAGVNGQVLLRLRSLDVSDAKNKIKQIPYWIDYTALSVNGKKIFGTLKPAWHGKPYVYKIEANAGEEIVINVKWFPHRSDFLEQKTVPSKFRNYLTARVDINLQTTEGDLNISSVSDKRAKISPHTFTKADRIGYIITSFAGSLGFIVKATVDGQINLKLRGITAATEDKTISYGLDYTDLIVNDQTILDTPTPVWYAKPYVYNLDVKADEEIIVKVAWLPHMGDFIEQKALPTPKVKSQVPSKFRNYLTARVDINLQTTEGDFQIISTSDSRAKINKRNFMKKDRIGYIITSFAGNLTLVAKATVDGQINLKLRGITAAPDDKDKVINYGIDYTALTVNDQTILDTVTPAWHDKPYVYKTAVKANEEIKIQIEWLPHMSGN